MAEPGGGDIRIGFVGDAGVATDIPKPKDLTAKEIFEQQLKPVKEKIKKTQQFSGLLNRYRSGLNDAFIQANKDGKLEALHNPTPSLTGDHPIYQWFLTQVGSNIDAFVSTMPPEKQGELITLVETQISEWAKTRGSQLDPKQRDQEMNRILGVFAQKFIEDSDVLSDLKNLVQNTTEDVPVTELTADHLRDLEVEAEILRLHPDVAAYEIKDWIGQLSREMLFGFGDGRKRKVFDTPHYKSILESLHRIGRKENGVGGVMLYGPPGTGKTELLREKNRLEGFETHVVSIHHYTSFGELLGERTVGLSMGIDSGANLATKLRTVSDHLRRPDSTPGEFRKMFEGIYTALKQEGKLSELVSFGQFMLPYVDANDSNVHDILAKPSLSDEDSGVLKNAFLSKLDSRIARAALNPDLQEDPANIEDVVRGEILLAIKRSKQEGKKIRVALDEIDKAGPGALGGLLGFLSKSRGEQIVLGSIKEEIPSWFVVDATSNSPTVDPFFEDRFVQFEVGTPPLQDQLAIAMVRLADSGGNILLKPYEQEQMVAFFAFGLPSINQVLHNHGKPAVSIRGIQEITAKLVDMRNASRTETSLGSAIRSYLLESRVYSDPEVRNDIDTCILQMSKILQDEMKQISFTPLAEDMPSTEGEASSPLTNAYLGLQDSHSDREVRFSTAQLTDTQQAAIGELLAKPEHPSTKLIHLPLGAHISLDDQGYLHYYFIGSNSNAHEVRSRQLGTSISEIVGATADGNGVLVRSGAVFSSFDLKGSKSSQIQYNVREGKAIWNEGGKYFAVQHDNNELSICALGKAQPISQLRAERCTFSSDGSLCVVYSGDSAAIYQSSTGMQVATLPSGSADARYDWQFIGHNLIVNKNNLSEGAVYYS